MSGPQSLTIDSTWLRVEDGSLSQPDSALVYTLTALPQNGTLTVDGTTLALNGQFTQQQIDDGLVVYTEAGTTAVGDSFGFSISDASSAEAAVVAASKAHGPARVLVNCDVFAFQKWGCDRIGACVTPP